MAKTAAGQSSLIVRLESDATAALSAALAGEAAKQGSAAAFAPLFADVADVRRLLPETPAAAAFPVWVIVPDDSAQVDALVERWATAPGVRYAQPNRTYRLEPALTAGAADTLRHLAVADVPGAWEVTRGRGVRVGFVDTGVYFEHPDLAGRFWVNPGEDVDGDGRATAADLNGLDDDGNGYVDDLRGFDFVDRPRSAEPGDYRDRDPDASEDPLPGGGRGHGTLIAGVLAAAEGGGPAVGVAPEALLVPLRAFGSDGQAEDDDVAAAIIYAADAGVDVLNLSFGDVYYSPLMHESIRYAVDRGVVVVASAGNVGGDDPHYPSDYPEVVSTAWLTADGRSVAGYGTFGAGVDLGAPGTEVQTTLFPDAERAGDDDALYGRRSGSSLSAPIVAGTAALVRSVAPGLAPEAVRGVLVGTARDIGTAGWDHATGAGLVSAARAVRRAWPSRVAIDAPGLDAGLAGSRVAVVGSAVHPSFERFALSFAPGTEDPDGAWRTIGTASDRQVLDDTLGVWDVGALPEGAYLLRLAVHLRSGATIEDRRRVVVDRSAPLVEALVLGPAWSAGAAGVAADVRTDDLATVALVVDHDGRIDSTASDRRGRRHGLVWTDPTGRGGRVGATLVAVNTAGLVTRTAVTVDVPPRSGNAALFERVPTGMPAGYLLPDATDFDADGLREIVLTRYDRGAFGDTLLVAEWAGDDFRRAYAIDTNALPRDVGDTDGDGLRELLLQAGGATLLLEQPAPGAYPARIAYIDTVGLSRPSDSLAAFGARLTDLDGDGRGEILVHNTRAWRVLEADGETYREVARLANPTAAGAGVVQDNAFQEPEAEIGDFDGDGRADLLAGDGDGDWIVYEAAGDDRFRVAWTAESRFYRGGNRFASGDLDGDGRAEFVTHASNWPDVNTELEREPALGYYFVWSAAGDDDYRAVDTLVVEGPPDRQGALRMIDFDGDGRDELVVTQAPDLYVFAFDAALRPSLLFHLPDGAATDASAVRTTEIAAADFDGDGRPELVVGGADERLHRLVYRAGAEGLAPPVWLSAFPDGGARLEWRAPQADSVVVYRSAFGGPLDPAATTAAGGLFDPVTAGRFTYRLAAWYDGTRSALSPARIVDVRTAPVFVEVSYPDPHRVALHFDAPLAVDLGDAHFTIDGAGSVVGAIVAEGGRVVAVRLDAPSVMGDTLRWRGLRSAEGAPVADGAVGLAPPPRAEPLIVERWTLEAPGRLRLTFSAPLDPATATAAANYTMEPPGVVERAAWSEDAPADVVVEIAGRPVGATGRAAALFVEGVRSAAGAALLDGRQVIDLTAAATDLAAAFVYPNPYRAGIHNDGVTIAGLTRTATVTVMTAQGAFVRRLDEDDGDGGVRWDLRDDAGRIVPSGVYLVRVEAEGTPSVLRKAVVVR